MNPAQHQKIMGVTFPVAILDDSSWTTVEVDTKGWDYAQYYVMLGATDIALTAMAVTESDASGSGHANVTGLVSATSTNIAGSTSALPTAAQDNKIWCFDIDLKTRKRYLDLTLTIDDGTVGGFAVAWCVLSRGETAPVTAAERGCQEICRV